MIAAPSKWGIALALSSLLGCSSVGRPIWHDTVLPSGKTIKVTTFLLAWGGEHDERTPGKDCLMLEFVLSDPKAEGNARDQEALEVFELIRPTSELWGLKSAEVLAFPQVERKGRYDIYAFTQGADGKWTFERTARKVFATDP